MCFILYVTSHAVYSIILIDYYYMVIAIVMLKEIIDLVLELTFTPYHLFLNAIGNLFLISKRPISFIDHP